VKNKRLQFKHTCFRSYNLSQLFKKLDLDSERDNPNVYSTLQKKNEFQKGNLDFWPESNTVFQL